jgi:hypothetical protein
MGRQLCTSPQQMNLSSEEVSYSQMILLSDGTQSPRYGTNRIENKRIIIRASGKVDLHLSERDGLII